MISKIGDKAWIRNRSETSVDPNVWLPVLRIRDVIPDPDFYPSRIPDLGSKNSNKREGWKKIYFYTIFCSHKFQKIVKLFCFWNAEDNLGQFSMNYRTFYPKNCQKAHKNMCLGSGIRKNLFRIPDPRVKKAPDPGSGSVTLLVTKNWSSSSSSHIWGPKTRTNDSA